MSRLYIDTSVTVRLIQVDCCIFIGIIYVLHVCEIELNSVRFNYEWFEIDKVLVSVLQVQMFTLYLYFKYIFLGVRLLLLE